MATIGEWAKMYGTGNYADTSKRIGDSVEEAINQNRVRTDRRRLAEDRERKQALEDYSMEQLKIQEYSAFNFPICIVNSHISFNNIVCLFDFVNGFQKDLQNFHKT